MKIGRFELHGFIAWVLWLVVHLAFLIGFRNRVATLFSWGMHVLGDRRSQLSATDRWVYGRRAIGRVYGDTIASSKIDDTRES